MIDTNWIIGIAAGLVLLIVILVPLISRRQKAKKLRSAFGSEYDRTVKTLGDEKKAQAELQERQKHVKSLTIRPLTVVERARYLSDWNDVQSKFVDEPGKAIGDADRLITEVMLLRNYPLSDFEQRAADISVSYPELATNYRAAKVIAFKNGQGLADTEELRQAMIYYRTLFEELLGKDPVIKEEEAIK